MTLRHRMRSACVDPDEQRISDQYGRLVCWVLVWVGGANEVDGALERAALDRIVE